MGLFLCLLPFELLALPVEQRDLRAKDFETATDGSLCTASDWAISDNGDPKRMQAAMAYAGRARCVEARAALVSRFLQVESSEVYEAAYAALSELTDAMVLTQILAQVERLEDGKAILALRLLSRICDQSCTPYVAAMLRHVSPEVAEEAAKTARILGDPKLAFALQEVVKSQAQPSLRLAAMGAWADIAKEGDYLALLSMLDPEKVDEVGLRIVRSLPKDLRSGQATYFAGLAERRALVTSVASAYLEAPDDLIDALLDRLKRPLERSARIQLLRTLALVLPSVGKEVFGFGDAQQTADKEKRASQDAENAAASIAKRLETIALLWPPNAEDIGIYAALFAALDLETALGWILARSEDLKPADWLEILWRVGPRNAANILSLVEDERRQRPIDPSFLASLVEHRGALGRAFAGLLDKAAEKPFPTLAQSLSLSADFQIARRGIEALGRLAGEESCATLEAMLIGADQNTAMVAMTVIPACDRHMHKLVERIAKAPTDDGWDAVYLARFALWIYVSGLDDALKSLLPWREHAAAEAYRCAELPLRRHAEPALLLLSELRLSPPPLGAQDFKALPSDNKRAYLRAFAKSGDKSAPSFLLEAAKDANPAVAAEALGWLGRCERQELSETNKETEAVLRQAIDSPNAMLCLGAMNAAADLQMTSLLNDIKKRLYDADERLVYGALWALQKLGSLADAETLKTLYYRMRSPILKKRLAFLSGLDPRFEKLPPAELSSGHALKASKRLQILTPEGRIQPREVTLLLDDQRLMITVPNDLAIVLYGD